MARWPLPSRNAFGLPESHGAVFEEGSQYVSSSLFPKPLAPVSNVQFAGLIAVPAAPLNSSHHCAVHVIVPVVLAGTPEHWAWAEAARHSASAEITIMLLNLCGEHERQTISKSMSSPPALLDPPKSVQESYR
jgi:hypothetical protein